MLIIGLTGGIGSGKSTVANLFAALGTPIIDSDVIAREIILQNRIIFEKMLAYFGSDILLENGWLDRNKLRQYTFEDPVKRQWLEQLLHPFILDEIKQRLTMLTAPYCIVVIPLLVEVPEAQQLVDRVLVVDASEEVQLMRTAQRDKTTVAEIKKITGVQASRLARLDLADDVIHNDGSEEALQEKVMRLHKSYLRMALLR